MTASTKRPYFATSLEDMQAMIAQDRLKLAGERNKLRRRIILQHVADIENELALRLDDIRLNRGALDA